MSHEHGGKSSAMLINTKKVVSFLKPGDVFLDVGCGPGDYLDAGRKITDKLIGIDIHKGSVDIVNKKGYKGILGDATKNIPLRFSSVDFVLVSNVMHGFFENKQEKDALKQIAMVLKNKGKLVIVEFKKNSLFGPPKDIRLEPEKVERSIVKAGFKKIEYGSVGLFNYMVVFEKV